jgi:hypothetical protein
MKKNLIFSFVCTFSFIIHSFAQDTSLVIIAPVETGPVKTKMFTLSPGYAFIDVDGLDGFMAPGTPGSFSNHFGTFGIQSTNECKRWIYGYTLQAGMSLKKTTTDYAGISGNNMEYYGTFADFLLHGGYSIVSTDHVKFYPLLGVGAGMINANFNRIDNLTVSQFSNDPGVQGIVTKYLACFDGALGLDFLISSKRWSDDGNWGKVIGLRVGYTQGVGFDYWRFAGARILENPGYNPGMIYAKVLCGLYKRKVKKDLYGVEIRK